MNPISAPDEAENFFHTEIPITRGMGVRVVVCDEHQFVVEAPVAANFNHLRTAFGGSINAVATLAGYGLFWSALRNDAIHVVIAESSIRFFRPVHEVIHAICLRPGVEEWNAFQSRLVSKGKAALQLRVSVVEGGKPSAEFKGTFVAQSRQTMFG